MSEDTYPGELNNPQSLNLYVYVVNNPLRYVDPSGYIPTVLEAARMAQHIYGATEDDIQSQTRMDGGWTIIDIMTNDEGLKMGVYSRLKKDGATEYSLVNKGTTTWGDWGNNFQQPIGFSTDMEDSIEKSIAFVNAHKDDEVTMVGHSKGGAEATANAVANNKNAITFNTALVHLYAYGLSKGDYTATMTHYVVEGEILNYIFTAPSIGKTVYLPQQHKIKWWHASLYITNQRIKNHSMNSVINALEEADYN
ncbi:hypothetical protein [Paenibacillus apis]|uniref:DUF2974 domain-containing protein n=1 Tax=Paenibacillus apis TaxID=1792174 RepID=A0A919Y1E8_9BACL|nr:hypothetical protein J41TS4_21040 [Paenibacillus apis]